MLHQNTPRAALAKLKEMKARQQRLPYTNSIKNRPQYKPRAAKKYDFIDKPFDDGSQPSFRNRYAKMASEETGKEDYM